MFLRESARVWCGIRRYSRSRITDGSRTAAREECTACERFLFRRGHALQYQHQRPPRRADIDRLVAGIQHQHGFLQSIARHQEAPPSNKRAGACPSRPRDVHAPVYPRHRQQRDPRRSRAFERMSARGGRGTGGHDIVNQQHAPPAQFAILQAAPACERRYHVAAPRGITQARPVPGWSAPAAASRANGMPDRRAISRASNSAWLNPRCQRRRQCSGTAVTRS